MTSVPCPRCGMPVGLEQEVCSHCRTPRDDMEMEEGRALVRNEELRLQRRPKRIAAGVAAAVLLTAAWFLRGLVIGPALLAWSQFRIEVEKTRQPGHWVKPLAPATAVVSPPAPSVAVSSFVYLAANAPFPAHAPAPAPASAPAPQAHEAPRPPEEESRPGPPPPPAIPSAPFKLLPPNPGEMRIHGTVYDLKTSKPVGGTVVVFAQKGSDTKWEATTNRDGRYQIGIFKNAFDDILVTIEAPGYRKGLLEDRNPPYRDRSASSRADLIAETTDSDLEPLLLRYKAGEQTVELDLVLVPPADNTHAP